MFLIWKLKILSDCSSLPTWAVELFMITPAGCSETVAVSLLYVSSLLQVENTFLLTCFPQSFALHFQ